MKKMMILATALIVAGCIDPDKQNTPGQDDVARTNGAYVVTVGVENGYAGACPGALVDCKHMSNLLKPYAYKISSFTDKTATRSNVVSAMKEGVKYPLFIFFYSGHGGSKVASYLDTTEADGRDEYLCLYDTPLVDNDIWAIISKSKGRVVMIFDCCHSGTMFRLPFAMKKQQLFLAATTVESGSINLLVWSGCPDSSYSYGDDTGGMLTNTLRKYFKASLTYDELWDKIEDDKSLKKYETVQRTIIGNDFGNKYIFQ